ncbi:phosphoenolpyruvate synthase [uncultured Chitinophaga sp.]|uniref:phosphoenolpyruvate synthase n=1 Tax=uncultured Chitinophaga sp. TaxID=339340 RepID=UPI0026330022|nr:phosphoenolpyruvate synthase [uncultured Chitinophaga sp.]
MSNLSFVLSFRDIDKTKVEVVGGKGANLGELSRIQGISVPDGYCITTAAFKKIIASSSQVNDLLDQLTLLQPEDHHKVRELSGRIRHAIEEITIPEDITEDITQMHSWLGNTSAFAIRSSATAEDLPTASFAGQQDTYLNISGKTTILRYISKCWASLFTERAISYRHQNRFDHRKVFLSVVVQQMIFPQAAGIMFTADPVTGNRKIVSIEASFGLGEALVSGLVNADTYKVRNGQLTEKKISAKQLAIYASEDGGTKEQAIAPGLQHLQTLTDEQILQLEQIGRKIEAHFGSPQDIEWCLAEDAFYIVQSRPITTLFPVPEAKDEGNRVYISVGHQQMMTDAMKPLGLSLFELSARHMQTAGGRLFVDITDDLASPARRQVMINVLAKSDLLFKDALTTIIERDFIKLLPADEKDQQPGNGAPVRDFQTLADYDPTIVDELIRRNEASVAALKQNIREKTGVELVDFILEDIKVSKKELFDPQTFGVIMTGMNAASWINEKMEEWLGEKGAADTLSQSVSNNITSAMGLALLDVADVIRPYPAVINYLQDAKHDSFLDKLPQLTGGQASKDAILAFLNKYGMRCAGEIDITRPRWIEKPATLIPMILSNISNHKPGASKRKFEQGLREALKKEEELLTRLKQLPDGEEKARETKRMIDLVRNLCGYREYPKYGIVSRYLVYKQALLQEAEQLVKVGIIREKEDIYFLSFDELRAVIQNHQLDYQLISKRKNDSQLFEKLTPPRVITSEGEIIRGNYQKDHLPDGAIMGVPVSSGVAEGRARVILNMEAAALEEGDILVTTFTDPSWTTLFVSIKGLVTEVGGPMTHGAVIAREYGLPAVVGMEHATRLIKDGQRIRVNGTDGYVEILS